MPSKAASKHAPDEPSTIAHIETIKDKLDSIWGTKTKSKFFKVLAENEDVLRNVVTRVCGERYKETKTQQDARATMDSYCGVGEAAMYFDYSPSEAELPVFAEVPLTKKELESIRYTHFLFAYLPISIREMQAVHGKTVLNWERYSNEEYIDAKSEPGWYLLQKTIIKESLNRSIAQQSILLQPNEELPTPELLVYAILLHLACIKEQQQLFLGMKLRSAALLSGNSDRRNEKGSGVILGSHDSTAPHCLHLAHLPVDHSIASVGVTGIRRLCSLM
jgi:hypothetical protein